VYVPIAVLIFLIFGPSIGILYTVCILWHHIHDTFFLGWGVMWFWPFSKKKWKFFPDRNGSITSIPVISWLPDEEEKVRKWSGGHDDGWIKRYYLRQNLIAYIEYGGICVALIILLLYYL